MAKRVFDIFFSFFGLLFLLPWFLLVGILIKLDSDGPVFFRQKRIGRNGKPFEIIKFRSMITGSINSRPKITAEGDKRITRIGRLLRALKIDELPQLINVFKGEMSLVGPRPEVPDFVVKYSEQERIVLSVKPGITDYASLLYFEEERLLKESNNLFHTYEYIIMPEKLKLNIEYISNQSIWLDIKLIFMTIKRILTGRN